MFIECILSIEICQEVTVIYILKAKLEFIVRCYIVASHQNVPGNLAIIPTKALCCCQVL